MGSMFEHPSNGYRERLGWPVVVLAFLFGPFYLAAKGLWAHALIYVAVVLGAGLAGGPLLMLFAVLPLSVLYAGLVPTLLYNQYLRSGWRRVA